METLQALESSSRASSVVDGLTYVKGRFTDGIYRVEIVAGVGWIGTREYVSFAEWAAAGFPEPQILEPRLVKLPWSPKIYPVYFWPDRNRNQGELIGETGRSITFEQWASIGTPAPQGAEGFCTVNNAPCHITKYATSDELFLTVFGPEQHKLTFADWQLLEFPTVDNHGPGVYKYSWDDRVFWTDPSNIGPREPNYSNVFSTGYSLTWNHWQQFGAPTPQVVASAKRDRFFVLTGAGYNPQVYFDGATGCFTVDAAMWARAGRPQPLSLPYGGFPSTRGWCV
ncbi:hypothetical protein [Oerskovia turbata]